MSDLTYKASVYSRKVKYTNFKGKDQEFLLEFALDPIELMQVITKFATRAISKSGNPAKKGQLAEITDEQQITFVRDLAARAAGTPSDDGESWIPFEDFNNHLAAKAFLTQLTSSDGDRKEFAEVVIIAPFRAFVDFAANDASNNPNEIKQFQEMLAQMEKVFLAPAPANESMEEKRARLQAEMEALTETPES